MRKHRTRNLGPGPLDHRGMTISPQPGSGTIMTTLSLARPRARRLISWRVRKLLIGFSYLVPAALCMLATVVVPIILAIKMSLYAAVLYKPQDYRFIGRCNYFRLFQVL